MLARLVALFLQHLESPLAMLTGARQGDRRGPEWPEVQCELRAGERASLRWTGPLYRSAL